MKKGKNHYQNALLIFEMVLLINVMSVAQAWHWGQEIDGEPYGLCDCKYFNYMNGWVQNAPVKFEGWSRDVYIQPLCFQGAISTIMLYFKWPSESHFNGYLNWENQNSTLTEINHIWQYEDIGNISNCWGDDPDNKTLSNCTVSNYCTVSDEIARLYASVKIACNYNYNDFDNYHDVFSNIGRFASILKNRLGFVNATLILSNVSTVADTLQKYISTLSQPIIGIENGHTIVCDGFRIVNQIKQIHVLTYEDRWPYWNMHNYHISYWTNLNDLQNVILGYVYNLSPDLTILNNQNKIINYCFGYLFIPNTSYTNRKGQLKIRNLDANNQSLYITITSYISNNGLSWASPTVLMPRTMYVIPTSNNLFSLPIFNYTVQHGPNDQVKLEILIENNSGRDINSRYILDDFHNESKVCFKKNGLSNMTMVEHGNVEMKTGQVISPPFPASGIKFIKNGVTSAMADANGNLYRTLLTENQTDWLSVTSHLVGGVVFRDINGNATQFVNSNGSINIGQIVQMPSARSPDPTQLLTLTEPIENELPAGQTTTIRWVCAPSFNGQINLFYSTDGINWNQINTNGGIFTPTYLWYDWIIPCDLKDKAISIKIQDYAYQNIKDILKHDIKIIGCN